MGIVGAPCRRWTAKDDAALRRLWKQGKGRKEIAHLLGRTERAIEGRCDRIGLLSRLFDGYTVHQVAQMFGVYDDIAAEWVERRFFPVRVVNPGAAKPIEIVTDEDLRIFIADAEHWHEWDVETITDREFRELAQHCRQGVVYYTLKEAARILGVCSQTVHYHINNGTLRAKRRGMGNWYIRADWLEAHQELPRRPHRGRREFTEEETHYLRTHRATATVAELARFLHREPTVVRRWCARHGLTGPTISAPERNYQHSQDRRLSAGRRLDGFGGKSGTSRE